jgi:hypothetical protein
VTKETGERPRPHPSLYVVNALLVVVCVRHGLSCGWRWDDVVISAYATLSTVYFATRRS